MNWLIPALTSAVFSAAAAVSQKKVLFKLEGLDFSFLVSTLSLIFCIPFFLTMEYSAIEPVNLLILFLKTIPGTAAFLFVMLSIKNMEISKALPLLALTPGFVAIFAFLVLGDTLTLLQSTGIVFLFVGTYLIETKSGQSILDPFRSFFLSGAYRFVIAALVLFTITSIADRYLLGRYKLMPDQFLAFQQLFISFNFLVLLFFYKKNPASVVRSIDRSAIKWIVFIAMLTIVYRYTEIVAVKYAPVALVLSIKRISVFFAVVIGGHLFKESSLLIKTIATAVIVAGVILIAK